jgi:hypothetical protein
MQPIRYPKNTNDMIDFRKNNLSFNASRISISNFNIKFYFLFFLEKRYDCHSNFIMSSNYSILISNFIKKLSVLKTLHLYVNITPSQVYLEICVTQGTRAPRSKRNNPRARHTEVYYTSKQRSYSVAKTLSIFKKKKNYIYFTKKKMILFLITLIYIQVESAPVEIDLEDNGITFSTMCTSVFQAMFGAFVCACCILCLYALNASFGARKFMIERPKQFSVGSYLQDTMDSFDRRHTVAKVENLPLWQVPMIKTHRTNR